MSKKKLLIIGPVVLLLVVGVAYKKVLAPKPAVVKQKIEGHLLALDPEFVINLAAGRYAKITVAVLLKEAPVPPPVGEAPGLMQNAAVRAIITDDLTGVSAQSLTSKAGRKRILIEIKDHIRTTTDEHILGVYFTDIAVQ
jgi:flagellar FliL protein